MAFRPDPVSPVRRVFGAVTDAPATTARRPMSAFAAAAAASTSLLLIWASRAVEPDVHYVSQLGASDRSTAAPFNLGLLLLAVATILLVHSGTPALRRRLVWWPVGVTLLVSGASFGTASAVPCTAGCPVPFSDGAAPQDAVHVASAVLGFGAAVVAMAQVTAAADGWRARLPGIVAMLGVGVCAATGGLISLAGGNTIVGGNLEFAATTVGIGWFVVLGVQTGLAGLHTPGRAVPARTTPRRVAMQAST